jgi:hypothetical protein
VGISFHLLNEATLGKDFHHLPIQLNESNPTKLQNITTACSYNSSETRRQRFLPAPDLSNMSHCQETCNLASFWTVAFTPQMYSKTFDRVINASTTQSSSRMASSDQP